MKINSRINIFLFFAITFSLLVKEASANHLQIQNFEVKKMDAVTNTITFNADVSWENSWRSVESYDAVWVFLKYSKDGGATWSHASMSGSGTNPMGFLASNGFEILVPTDEKGFFLQRTDLTSGNVFAQKIQFVWDYNQDGLTDEQAMASNTVNKIFGIEMVNISQGSFYAGDGDSSSDFHFKQGSSDNDPWYIQNENAITTTNLAADGFYYTSSGVSGENSTGDVFLIPSSFPKGCQSFYLMKYELTEQQWVSFFNTLTPAQKINRDITAITLGGKNSDGVVDRNTIAWDSTDSKSNATTSRPDRPVSYISWPDLLSYSDWAGLRPITELEYEKAARGKDVPSVINEYVWGTVASNDALSTEINPNSTEDGNETITDGAANLNRNNLGWNSGDGRSGGIAQSQKGPLRAGIFAESSTNRVTSGAGFYGNMELSGNLSEMVVTVGKNQGRQFRGTHGDGQLSALVGFEGNATNIDWPGIDSTDSERGITQTVGSGTRGGDFNSTSSKMFQTSNRSNASKDPDSLGYYQRFDNSFGVYQGGRLARSLF